MKQDKWLKRTQDNWLGRMAAFRGEEKVAHGRFLAVQCQRRTFYTVAGGRL